MDDLRDIFEDAREYKVRGAQSGFKLEKRYGAVCGGRIVSTSSRNYHGVQNWIGETGFSRARARASLRSLGATRSFVFSS